MLENIENQRGKAISMMSYRKSRRVIVSKILENIENQGVSR